MNRIPPSKFMNHEITNSMKTELHFLYKHGPSDPRCGTRREAAACKALQAAGLASFTGTEYTITELGGRYATSLFERGIRR